MMSAIWMLACPLGMFAMGGVAWGLRRLPGRRAERLARTASRASCMSMGARPVAEADGSARDTSIEDKTPAHV
jgi:hypothetical protein